MFDEKDKNTKKEKISLRYTFIFDDNEGKTTMNTMVSLCFCDNIPFFCVG
jgi:hypothetical protein